VRASSRGCGAIAFAATYIHSGNPAFFQFCICRSTRGTTPISRQVNRGVSTATHLSSRRISPKLAWGQRLKSSSRSRTLASHLPRRWYLVHVQALSMLFWHKPESLAMSAWLQNIGRTLSLLFTQQRCMPDNVAFSHIVFRTDWLSLCHTALWEAESDYKCGGQWRSEDA
jgi:hypothetical protein